ncbi:MAG: hypothetical protein AB7O68_26500 [Pirellulales bacterium]
MKDGKFTLDDIDLSACDRYAAKWIANALSTEPMNARDRRACRGAIRQMYQLANLAPPAPEKDCHP